jgi:hypothetical protein
MRIHRIFYGLPRLSEEALNLHFSSVIANDVKIENYFCFWPALKFADPRETVLIKSDNHEVYIDLLNQKYKQQNFHNLSNVVYLAEELLDEFLKLIKLPIKYPEDNLSRPANFKISLIASCSQTIIRSFAVDQVLSNHIVDPNDVVIITRPDVALDRPFSMHSLSPFISKDIILVPQSGHHYGGMPDTMIVGLCETLKSIIRFPDYFFKSLNDGNKLEYEKIIKDFFLNEGKTIKSFDRTCLTSRNSRYKHSGLDGFVKPDFILE